MKGPILVTGSAGMLGRALGLRLAGAGVGLRGLDRVGMGSCRGDVRDPEAVARAMAGCRGVVHLAAVSRVGWGERDPAECLATNVEGTRCVVREALRSPERPWVLLASSREVYGRPGSLPVSEDAPRAPCNVYGRSKCDAEDVMDWGRGQGLATATLRLASVYGGAGDHGDRVVAALARGAGRGERLRVAGGGRVFDFTHVDDVIAGLWAAMERLTAGAGVLPVVHLVSGQGTTLGQLAEMALAAAGRAGEAVTETAAEAYEVDRFVGDPTRAREVLGWSARVALAEGVGRMVRGYAGA